MQYELIGASVFTVFCIALARVYSYVNRILTYWDRKNVDGPRPTYVFGNWKGFAHKFLGSEDCSNTAKYGKVYGTYDGMTPNLLVTDPEIIKEILDTSSEDFQDFRFISENSVVLKDSLLSLSGGEKSEVQMLMNSLLNRNKLEKLLPKLNSSVEELKEKMIKERQEDGLLNITSTVSEFIYDAIALGIFGIELNADVLFKEEFIRNCEKIFTVKDPQSVMSLLPYLYGSYFKEFWICPDKTLQYFLNLIVRVMSESSETKDLAERTECNLIELMVEAAKEEKKLVNANIEKEDADLVLKDNVIISKCIASMLTLSNATRTAVLLGLYVLANNEEVQEILYNEVEENKSKALSCEVIQNLNYLDKVVREILRLYPFEFRLEKVATKNTKVGEIELEKGVRVSIPLFALHRSKDLYEEPEKFNPERFSLSSSERRNPFTYLPFGQAGINGSNFAIQLGILATKLTLYRLVENFKFSNEQEKGLHKLFKIGFTRIPCPQNIDIIVEPRIQV